MTPDADTFIVEAFDRLRRGLHEHGDDLRNVQLATVAADGSPHLRTVILRGFEHGTVQHDTSPCLEVHSDARAGKVRDIVAGRNRVSLLAWSGADRLQIRCEGVAAVHRDDDLARDRWDRLSAGARTPYGYRADPGATIPDPADRPHLPPDEQARQFAVLRITVTSVDVLRLGEHGAQTRASKRFGNGVEAAHWIGA